MRIKNFSRVEEEEIGRVKKVLKHDTGYRVAVVEEDDYSISVAITDPAMDFIGRLFEDVESEEQAKKLASETARQFPKMFEKYHDGNSLVVAEYQNGDTAFEDETIDTVIVSASDVEEKVDSTKYSVYDPQSAKVVGAGRNSETYEEAVEGAEDYLGIGNNADLTFEQSRVQVFKHNGRIDRYQDHLPDEAEFIDKGKV